MKLNKTYIAVLVLVVFLVLMVLGKCFVPA